MPRRCLRPLAWASLALAFLGKLRDRVRMPAGLSEVEVEQRVRASEKVQRALDGREPARVVHVPGRLVNLVVE